MRARKLVSVIFSILCPPLNISFTEVLVCIFIEVSLKAKCFDLKSRKIKRHSTHLLLECRRCHWVRGIKICHRTHWYNLKPQGRHNSLWRHETEIKKYFHHMTTEIYIYLLCQLLDYHYNFLKPIWYHQMSYFVQQFRIQTHIQQWHKTEKKGNLCISEAENRYFYMISFV